MVGWYINNYFSHLYRASWYYQSFLTFICLRATSLSYDAHRTVRSWRQNSFGCILRWPWNTLRNYMCGVSLVAGRSKGSTIQWSAWSADCGGGGGVGKQWTEKESFQQYFYNRYEILHTCHTYCCYAYHFYAYWLYFIYVWHVCVSPKTYKWFGTSSLKMEGIRLLFFYESDKAALCKSNGKDTF
jgi:hypothetical protein